MALIANDSNVSIRQTGNQTVTHKSGHGILNFILINDNTTGGLITVYDNTAGSGEVIIKAQIGTPSGGIISTTGVSPASAIGPLNIRFDVGLTVVTSNSSNNDINVVFQ